MRLTKGQIEEALGRAALVEELRYIQTAIDEDGYVGPFAERMKARAEEIAQLLWGETEASADWREKIENASRGEAKQAIELLLRRRPEVTPPEDVEEWTLDQMVEWLIEKIGELPEGERDAWIQ